MSKARSRKKIKTGLNWLDRALVVSPYCFALCKSEKQFHAELKCLGISKKDWPEFVSNTHLSATTHFFEKETKNINRCCIVCVRIPKGHSELEIAGLLVYEAVHIWQAIRDNIGETRPSSEFEAYAIQCISQRLIASWGEK